MSFRDDGAWCMRSLISGTTAEGERFQIWTRARLCSLDTVCL